MKSIPIKWKLIGALCLFSVIGFGVYSYLSTAEPVTNYSDRFIQLVMRSEMDSLSTYAKCYKGKEIFFFKKINEIDSVFGKIVEYKLTSISKEFSEKYHLTYRITFSKAKNCVVFINIEGSPGKSNNLRLANIDITEPGANKNSKGAYIQYISIRPLRDSL
jgi:hypothetical protein